jgi:tetratricopeptide (TPR) repeat protein
MVFLVSLLPALGFIWMRGGIFAERFLYAATLGFAILLVFGIALILKFDIKESEQPDRKLLSILDPKVLSIPFVILGLLGAVYAFQRNFNWKDNRTLFSTDLAKSPESAQNNKHLAHEILQDAILEKDSVKKYALREEAIKLFRKAITINPRFGEAWGDLGRAYHDVGFNKDSAIKFYKTTMNITPGGFNTYSNLALIYVMMGKYKLASYYFNQSLVINPNFAIGRKHKEDIKRATGYDIHDYPLDEADGPPAGIGAQVSLAPLKR